MRRRFVAVAGLWALAACSAGPERAGEAENAVQGAERVAASGKRPVPLGEVPPEVLAAARAARPGFEPAEAEAEVRDGRNYFDVGGRLADGSDVEFDIMEENGRWRVVETQRDIALAAAPAPVRAAAAAHDARFVPNRVIESVQADGLVIYELYGPEGGDAQGRKVEIRFDGRRAEVLRREWAH